MVPVGAVLVPVVVEVGGVVLVGGVVVVVLVAAGGGVVGVVEVDSPVVVLSGCVQSSSACPCRCEIPCCSLARRPASTLAGSAAKSCSVVRSAASVGAQSPPPFSAACSTFWKSATNGPAFSEGISPAPELPQETSTAALTPSRPAGRQCDEAAHRH